MVNQVLSKFDQKQFGALRGLSTTHAPVTASSRPVSVSDGVLFVDFSKPLDRVDHTVVINKLIELGIPGSVIKWFASFLTNRQQCVRKSSATAKSTARPSCLVDVLYDISRENICC